MQQIIPVILSGGAGSRLWPLSREMHPKPFIKLGDGYSLLQKTFMRGASLPGVEQILTVTNREFFFKTADEYREVNHDGLLTAFLLEPFGRNTAAAIAAATLYVAEKNPDAIVLILPADHLIADEQAFVEAVERAVNLAAKGFLVTFGIKPDAPEAGYGYIEAEGVTVKRFVEKPDAKTAQTYLDSGRFYWNSGMFCFTVRTMLNEMRAHCPDILNAVGHTLERSRVLEGEGFTQCELDFESFAEVPEDSIDYAVMEKSNRVAVVPCDIDWSDIGSWSALGSLSDADARGNRIEGEAVLYDVANCIIHNEDHLIGAVGVDNLIIVNTSDALLVARKDRAQDVKLLYTELKARGHEAYKFHRTVHRPWGTYTILEEGNCYKIKRIVVKPGASLSLQMHHHRSEHWIVVSGMAKVINGEQEILVATNESTYIPAGHCHRVSNPGVVDLVMIEVQSGEYLGEDDIVRFEDHYGRC